LHYTLTLIAYFFLLFGQIAAILLLDTSHRVPTSVSILFNTLPLLFFLRGVLHARIRTHKLITLLIWFYFVVGVWNVTADITRLLGIIQISGSLLLFASSFAYVYVINKKTS
jgi:uncharacterized membrane protein